MTEDEDNGINDDYVAVCPITPELARQIVDLADLSWRDWEVTEEAMSGLGWRDNDVVECINGFVTDQGQVVYTDYDGCFYMPFCHYFWVGGETWTTDEWGSLPGWSSRKGADREEFNAHFNAAVDRFAELLGPPECDLRAERPTPSTVSHSWRYVAWRRGGNVLAIGQTFESCFSHGHDEQAVVYIGALAEEAPFPEADKFADFIG
jgi:hypothetical protein